MTVVAWVMVALGVLASSVMLGLDVLRARRFERDHQLLATLWVNPMEGLSE